MEDQDMQKVREQSLKNSRKKVADEVTCYQGLSYKSTPVKTKLISKYYDDSLAGYFEINQTQELIT